MVTLALLVDQGVSAEAIRRHLSRLRPAARQGEGLALRPWHRARLWRLAAADASRPSGVLVPDGSAVYAGRNSLRLFSRFEKWFAQRGDLVIGCNRHPLSPLIGPGYFSVNEPAASELEFDYSKVPATAPEGWPAPRANTRFLARQVYGELLDRVVWVAPDVLIGAAFRSGAPLDSYFILVRSA